MFYLTDIKLTSCSKKNVRVFYVQPLHPNPEINRQILR